VEILNNKKNEFQIIEYLKDGLTANQLKNILKKLDLSIYDIIRKKDKLYKELELEKIKKTDKILEILSKNIKLLERPIIIKGDRAIIGRPPEKINELFQ
tara:strand:+ start:336 stop:632 length:297 start_codon:yes stop_codon:yes gene_type:complete